MKAVAVISGQVNSIHLADLPKPSVIAPVPPTRRHTGRACLRYALARSSRTRKRSGRTYYGWIPKWGLTQISLHPE